MDFEPEPEHTIIFDEPMIVKDLTVYTTYKGISYQSNCTRLVMINNSIVIKNALESDNSNSFSVPYDIEPHAFNCILSYLHTPKYASYNIDMKDEKNIQHMLLVCNWFGMTNIYKSIMKCYKSLLQQSRNTFEVFAQTDNKLYEFLDLKYNTSSFVVQSVLHYNPIYGLITGDKLNDAELIDFSLSLFDITMLSNEVHQFIKTHCTREKTRQRLDSIMDKQKILNEFERMKILAEQKKLEEHKIKLLQLTEERAKQIKYTWMTKAERTRDQQRGGEMMNIDNYERDFMVYREHP